MQVIKWFSLGNNSWKNGLLLAVINSALALFCVITFFGSFFLMGLFVELFRSSLEKAPKMLFFPFPILWPLGFFVLYTALLLFSWLLFRKRLPSLSRKERLITSIIGVTLLLGLSLLGYASVLYVSYYEYNQLPMPELTMWFYGIISTAVVVSAIICIAILTFKKRTIK